MSPTLFPQVRASLRAKRLARVITMEGQIVCREGGPKRLDAVRRRFRIAENEGFDHLTDNQVMQYALDLRAEAQ